MTPQLRPYQLDAIAALRLAASQGSRAVLAVSPTGSGKTTIASQIAASAVARGRRVLWLAHRAELVEQAFDRLCEFGLEVGCIAASSSRPPNPYCPVQVASIQTLLARNERPRADILIYDECHHAVSDEWSTLVRDYSNATLLGFTATPERSDGKGLGAIFDRIVVVARVRELVDDGYLVPCDLIRPADRLRAGSIAQRPVDAYLAHARGRRCIVFSPSVPAAEAHAEEFNGLGVMARVVTGKTPRAERELLMTAFKTGKIQVLVNVYVATEGFDVPNVSAVILARGCGTAGTYIQMAGRGARPSPGKSEYLLIDLHGVSHVHGSPEDDREYSLDGKGIRRAQDLEIDMGASCRVCGAPIEPGEACAECGTAPRELEPPKVTGDPLVKYAAKRREDDGKRAETLARWMRDCASKGHKAGAARHRYRAVYGEWPPHAVEHAAHALLKERAAS